LKDQLRHPKQQKSVRLFVPIILGLVTLTASVNLPDFDYEMSSSGIHQERFIQMSNTSKSTESSNEFSYPSSQKVSGQMIGWNSTGEVLP
jgi:hypothetical protein